MSERRWDKSDIRTRPGVCGDVGHYEPREIAHQDNKPCKFKGSISSILVLSLNALYSSYLPLVPEHLSSNIITSSRIDVTWQSQCNLRNYEVTASNSQGANSSCSVGLWKMHATCEGISPCTEYNISVRVCHPESGCGGPAILNVTTTPGRKFNEYFSDIGLGFNSNLYTGRS